MWQSSNMNTTTATTVGVLLKILFIVTFASEINLGNCRNEKSLLSRHKRYLVFPEGSSLSVAACMTAVTIAPTTIWTEGLNWGISYDLPNDTSIFKEYKKYLPKPMAQRRHRRDLYHKMEVIMDSMGYTGRPCIYRALCETARRFRPNGNSLVEEIIRIVFRFPQQRVLSNEPEEHRLYHWAFRRGRENTQQECSEMFPQCPISLVDMALGYYSEFGQLQ